ncbi:MAG: hypothetical protein BGO10_05755 [Chlamydia sp. 32-24]|nr:MAG: hypothetical protein BGO10_05755 [Chlamydia sp. 32-24]
MKQLKLTIILSLLTALFSSNLTFAILSDEELREYEYMDKIARESDPSATSGKGSNYHDYTKVYSKYFAPIRNKRIKLLEIGVFEGNGVKMWEQYLPNADLHFVDITFAYLKYFSLRSKYYLANQENPVDLTRVVIEAGGNFDVIIDDGGHTMNQQLVSFHTLFPHVKNGGMYIIEDLHTSYWKAYGGNGTPEAPLAGPNTFIGFLKNLIDDVNYVGARTYKANHDLMSPELKNSLGIYQREIESIHFYDSLCIIIKR